MKDCLGFCLLILFSMCVRAEERQSATVDDIPVERQLALTDVFSVHRPHFPIAIQDLIVDGEARWAQDSSDRIAWRGDGEARIEYLLSSQKANEWVLKAGSEIQLYPPPEALHEFLWRSGCLLFHR